MNTKTQARQRRAKKSRVQMRTAGSVRLSVHRTPRHIYAQIISGDSKTVLAQASTLDKDLRSGATGNVSAAAAVGKLVAERAKAAGLNLEIVTPFTPSSGEDEGFFALLSVNGLKNTVASKLFLFFLKAAGCGLWAAVD